MHSSLRRTDCVKNESRTLGMIGYPKAQRQCVWRQSWTESRGLQHDGIRTPLGGITVKGLGLAGVRLGIVDDENWRDVHKYRFWPNLAVPSLLSAVLVLIEIYFLSSKVLYLARKCFFRSEIGAHGAAAHKSNLYQRLQRRKTCS